MREKRRMILKVEYHPRTWDDRDSCDVEFERLESSLEQVFFVGAGGGRRE
jgi:hypothetical protein